MAARVGMRATMGSDLGLRTGVKVAVVNTTGKLVATDTVRPSGEERHRGALREASGQAGGDRQRHASREMERFFLEV